LKKKRDYLFNIAILDLYSIFVLNILVQMSGSKSKNLERKLDNFAKEAKNELNNVCGSSLWESLGFVFFDQLGSAEKIAKANFYYGQLQIINEIKYSILLKLFILPLIIFLICKFLNFNFYQSSAVILQAATPTAISTILMAEAYGVKQKIASKILFTTTLISIITIPLLKIFMNLFIGTT